MKKTSAIILLAALLLLLSACSRDSTNVVNVSEPEKTATADEIYPAQNENAVEEYDNVNGMRFTMTLEQLTESYNNITRETGTAELLNYNNWKKTGEVNKDSNGVSYQNYYYDCKNYSLTAAVEVQSQKLMNVGCGTTTNIFVSQENGSSYSDVILRKCAVMATAVCGFPVGSVDLVQDIFYRTTFENSDSLWYQGCIYNMSVKEDKADSENSTMLFRVFPVTQELKAEWQIADYEAVKASAENGGK